MFGMFCDFCGNKMSANGPRCAKRRELHGTKNYSNKGAIKHDQEKPRTDLYSSTALLKLADVLGFGASGGKYGDHNWRQGLKWSRVLGATLRHLLSYLGGEDKDPESGISHMAHVMCNAMFLLEFEETHKELDDRYKVDSTSKK